MKNFVGHNAFSRGVNAAALQPSSGWNGCDVCSLLSFILIFIADAGGIGLILAFMDLGSKNHKGWAIATLLISAIIIPIVIVTQIRNYQAMANSHYSY